MQNVTPTLTPQHSFAKVPVADINRSTFNRSHSHKTTFDAGYLIPILVDEIYPGDTVNLTPSVLARLSPTALTTPLMDQLDMDIHAFFVPNRLLWTNWEKMQGQRTDPDDSIDFTTPMMTSPVGGYAVGSLQHHMGLPAGVAGFTHSALPLRAYNLIYNTWYRDQNLIDSATVDTGDAGGTVTNYVLRRRGKRHDYFTSALPWPQKGDAVSLPLGSTAPVSSTGVFQMGTIGGAARNTRIEPGGFNYASFSGAVPGAVTDVEYKAGLEVDLSTATAATINSIRLAISIQQLLERDARGGTRYTEIIHSHFGVVSPDARMQRPEYLGGGTVPIITHPVANTSGVSGDNFQGQLTGYGIGAGSGSQLGFVHSFTEHGQLIILASVRAPYTYARGVNRMWSRSTRYDYYMPTFANLGEQTILNKEIYTQGTSADADPFGYQERWAELRYKPSLLTGLMDPYVAGTLSAWHLGQQFSSLPLLNQDFIEENPPLDRVIAVPSEPHLIVDAWFQISHVRALPVFSVPGLRTL